MHVGSAPHSAGERAPAVVAPPPVLVDAGAGAPGAPGAQLVRALGQARAPLVDVACLLRGGRSPTVWRPLAAILLLATAACEREEAVAPGGELRYEPGTVLWWTPGHAAGRVSMDAERVFFPGRNHEVIAVAKGTGKVLWRTPVPGLPIPALEGTVVSGPVVAYPDGYLYGLDRERGTLRWAFAGDSGSLPGWGTPAAADDVVYAGAAQGQVYAIDANSGHLLWRQGALVSYPAVSNDPVVANDQLFVGYSEQGDGQRGGLAALDRHSGAVLWFRDFTALLTAGLSAHCFGNVAVDSVRVYAWASNGDLLAFDRFTGALRWQQPSTDRPGWITMRQLVLANNILVVGSAAGHIEGRSPETGALLWAHPSFRGAIFDPVSTDGTTAYLTVAGGHLVALTAQTGQVAWTAGFIPKGLGLFGTAAIGDTAIYLGGSEGLFAFHR